MDVPNKKLIDAGGGTSSFTIQNKSKTVFVIIDFENCVFKGNFIDSKCDYGLETDTSIYFIELKGSNLEKGCYQLKSTINQTKKCFKEKNIEARLVVTKVRKPKLYKNTPDYKQLIKILKTPNNLIIGSKNLKENI